MVVRSLIPEEYVWLGATDADREGEWVWIYGDGTKRKITVSIPWGPNEPEGGKVQNCIKTNRKGEFMDVECTSTGHFHCQLTKKGN